MVSLIRQNFNCLKASAIIWDTIFGDNRAYFKFEKEKLIKKRERDIK